MSPFPGDPLWALSVLPHALLGAWSLSAQPHPWGKMESKVSDGGLNVTLTIRLLMHGKVGAAQCGRDGAESCSPVGLTGFTASLPPCPAYPAQGA